MRASPRWSRTCSAAVPPAASRDRSCFPRPSRPSRPFSIKPGRNISNKAMHTVHVRVNDAATGKPTPCRVRFTDAEGRYYAPFGRLTEFATAYGVDVGGNVLVDGKKYAYIDGSCEIALPPGKINIDVHKGPEYTPLHIEHELLAGKLSLRLTLERWINL